MVRPQKWKNYGLTKSRLADHMGEGSAQATVDPSSAGKDDPFWNALNKYVKNLRAIISGHGESFCLVRTNPITPIGIRNKLTLIRYLTIYHL
jgi:hypothetical protein